MTEIQQDHFINSITDGFQYISYYHPPDFITSLSNAYEIEASPTAKSAIGQILLNSKMCALGKRPICQDTGIAVVFLDIGMNVRWNTSMSIEDMVNEGVRRAYLDPDNPLRASIMSNPVGARKNTGDNTPAVIHMNVVPGNSVNVILAAKGGGSENKARFAVLNPSDDIADWVVNTVPGMGAGWCPPGILSIGVGGTPEKAMLLAKRGMMDPINMHELIKNGPRTDIEKLRVDIYHKVNALGIGAQGLGGVTTVLDVKILDYPTHAASKPVAMIPNCAANRHIHFTLDGSGAADFPAPDLAGWPDIKEDSTATAHKVDLDNLDKLQIAQWKPGDTLLISGKLLTGRDAAHKRICELLDQNKPLPPGVDFTNKFIYYVGPVDAVRDEAVGPAGPTTATRMDKFTEQMLAQTGLIGMIGKAERGPEAIKAIKKHGAVYLIATGGAAFLVSKAIRSAKVIAFEEMGMEAIYEFEVKDMPVTVAVDSSGNSIHISGPKYWQQQIAGIPVK
jgi:fumarate hydratase class I